MNHYHRNIPGQRGFGQPPVPPQGGQFPGIGDPFAQGGGAPGVDPFAGPPAVQGSQFPGVVPGAGAGGGSKGPFGLPNMADIKVIIDRMGGIDGILSTMQKVQKFVGTMQQMAPMLKLLTGAFGAKKAKAASSDDGEWRPKRRRRRRRTGARRRRRR